MAYIQTSKSVQHMYSCDLSFIPVRTKPSDTAEMSSMILFGETFKVLKTEGDWHQIAIINDGYKGWIYRRYLSDFCAYSNDQQPFIVASNYALLKSNHPFSVSIGSVIYGFKNNSFLFDGKLVPIDGEVIPWPGNPAGVDKLLSYADRLLNTPYLWGGRSVFGVDCSGFVQLVFRMTGCFLNRDANLQIKQGTKVPLFKDARPGDLAFFENDMGKIVHVGILGQNSQIYHASEKVRIDTFTDKGIVRLNTAHVTHKLHSIRRIFS